MIERGLAIYIAIGVVIIVSGPPLGAMGGRGRERERERERESVEGGKGWSLYAATYEIVSKGGTTATWTTTRGGGGNKTGTHTRRRFSEPLHLRLYVPS